MSSRQPRVTGISPQQGTPGIKITVRGENLGKNVTDLISISICGVDCSLSAEWVSPSKVTVRPGLCEGEGDIVITTKSGGNGISLVKFTCLVQDKIGILEDSGIFLDEDEADSTPVETDVLNILSDPFPSIPSDMCNFNLSEFNPEEYVTNIYSTVSFDSLKTGLQTLKFNVRPHDREPFEFLKKHLSLHFECYRRLDDLKNWFVADKQRNLNLNSLNKLHMSLVNCFSTLLSRHERVERCRQLITHFNRWRSLFTLPSSLEKNISRGNYQEAIDDFKKAVEGQKCVKGMPTVLELIYTHSERQISRLKDRLKDSLIEDDGMTLREHCQSLMIIQDNQLVQQFMGVQFGKIRDRLNEKIHTDSITSLNDVSSIMTRAGPDFTSLCDFCKSMGIEIDDLGISLVKVYGKVIRDLLPKIEQIDRTDKLNNLELALKCHRRCALLDFNGSERVILARLSHTVRLACLNAYFNCCLREIEALFNEYINIQEPLNRMNWFPDSFFDLIRLYAERIETHVLLEIHGELDFFKYKSAASLFSRRFSQLIAVYSQGLKDYLKDIEFNWHKLAVLIVDVESVVSITDKKLHFIVESHKFPKLEDKITEFTKTCLRRRDDLFKKLIQVKSDFSVSTNRLDLNGMSSHVFSVVNKVVNLCSEIALISTILMKRVLQHVCDDFLEKLLSDDIVYALTLVDLWALKMISNGFCSVKWIEVVDIKISSRSGGSEIFNQVKERLSIQLEAISTAANS